MATKWTLITRSKGISSLHEFYGAGGRDAGRSFYCFHHRAVCRDVCVYNRLRAASVGIMTAGSMAMLTLCALLLVYLTFALLRPEKF
jgi:K+-transporting ATPase KdpF subunit